MLFHVCVVIMYHFLLHNTTGLQMYFLLLVIFNVMKFHYGDCRVKWFCSMTNFKDENQDIFFFYASLTSASTLLTCDTKSLE